jgi:predicted dienelactone hydrolase
MGFSLGGNSVLLMAGARMSLEAYQAYCQTMLSPQSDCAWLRRGGVDLATVDKSRFDKESRDPRISAFVATDPGFAPGYRTDSLRTIIIPGLLLNLGIGSDVPVTLKADSLAAAIPQAEFASIAGAVHFSFLGLCNPNGAELLKAENDDPVCNDDDNLPRQALHQQMLQRIGLFLTKTLLER